MAIDTAQKRLSVQGYGGGASAVMPLPIGASTAASRADVVWLYSGLKYAAASTVDTHDGLYAHEPRYVPSSERARRRRREKEKLRQLIEEAAEPRREPAPAPVEIKERADPRPRRTEPEAQAPKAAAPIREPRTVDLSSLSEKLDALVASRHARARAAAEKAEAARRLADAAQADRRAAEEAERERIRAEEAAKAAEEARRLREHNRRVVMLLLAA